MEWLSCEAEPRWTPKLVVCSLLHNAKIKEMNVTVKRFVLTKSIRREKYSAMIEFTKAFKASDGTVYGSLEDAQANELVPIIEKCIDTIPATPVGERQVILPIKLALLIVAERNRVVDILTTTESSRPRARKANGGTKKRKPATVQTSETSPA